MDPAEPDHQHRAKIRIARRAEDHLTPRPRHRLDQDAIYSSLGMRRPGSRHHPLIGIAGSDFATSAERNSDGLGLMSNVARLDLERDGAVDVGGGSDRLLGI